MVTITLQKIAELAHVSKCAASYAFSDNPAKRGKLSEETRQRILAVAAELNYHPSVAGRGLALSRSYSLGLLLPRKNVQSFSPHAMGMFHGVADAISKSDYILPLFFGWSEKLETNLRQHRLDGLLVMARMQESPVFDKLNQLDIPVLCLNRRSCGPKAFSVMTDMQGWVCDSLALFASRGYKRAILFTSGPTALAMDVDLAAHFPALCQAHGLAAQVDIVDNFDGTAPAGTALLFRGNAAKLQVWFAKGSSSRRRTAVFCAPEKCAEMGYPLDCCSYHDSNLLGATGVRTLLDAVEKRNVKHSVRLPYQKALEFKPCPNTFLEEF